MPPLLPLTTGINRGIIRVFLRNSVTSATCAEGQCYQGRQQRYRQVPVHHSESDREGTDQLALRDGSTIAVIGGGPAGSLFSYFVLDMADRSGLDLNVTIYEPKEFNKRGPSGCNMCGGIVSESLVQLLATEGINLPPSVVQRGIEAYVLHTDVGTVRVATPLEEKRIAAVHRGGGPAKSQSGIWHSFDGYLLNLAIKKGATRIAQSVTAVTRTDGRPTVTDDAGNSVTYDLLVIAAGVNAATLNFTADHAPDYRSPNTTKTVIREYHIGESAVREKFGDSMHLFLMNIPHLEFAAAIPKGDCVTLCCLGSGSGKDLLDSFFHAPAVQFHLESLTNQVCACAPRMSISAAHRPYADRLLFIGDCCLSRLYKDGIGAAYREAKAAATAVVFWGVSDATLEKHYYPSVRAIARDNSYGHVVFAVTHLIQRFSFAQRAVVAMVSREQKRPDFPQRMSTVLWDTFTGSASYRDVFFRTLHPAFWLSLAWHLAGAIVCPRRNGRSQSNGSSRSQV